MERKVTQMVRMRLLLFALILPTLLMAQSDDAIEFVESIPVETSLDNEDIRNTSEVWKEMISGARERLDIEQFYVSTERGEPLDEIIDSILAAARRGVSVRLIADARMYKTYPATIDMLGKEHGIRTRIIDFRKLAGGVQHSKFFIVDSREIFLGSQNFDWRALKHIHELGLRVRHPDVAALYQEVFDIDWEVAETNDSSEIPKFPVQHTRGEEYRLLSGPSDTVLLFPTMSPKSLIPDTSRWDESNIVKLIDGARRELSLQFLSYSPIGRDKSYYEVLDNAMRRAASRGVKVRLFVSDWAKDHPEVDHLKSLALVPNIEVRFSVFPEWSGGYIPFARVDHCKFIVADSLAFWLGTSNGEKSYFHTSRNLGIIVRSPAMAARLRQLFLKGWESEYAEPVRAEKEYEPRRHGEN